MHIAAPRLGRIPIQAPIVLALLIAGALAILRWREDAIGDPDHLVVSGTVEADSVAVGSKVGGRLSSLKVKEGDRVEAGQLLAEFDVPDLEAQRSQLKANAAQAEAVARKLENGPRGVDLAQALASVEAAKAQLAELKAGSRSEDVEAAKASWHAAELQYEQARADLRRAEELFAQGVIPESQLEQSRTAASRLRDAAETARQQYEKARNGPRDTQIEVAEAQVRMAQAAYDQLAAGSRQEDIEAARSSVEAARSQISVLDTKLAESQVFAPTKGEVLTVNQQPGDLLAPNQPVCDLLIAGSYYVQVYVPENRIAWALPGSKAQLSIDGYAGKQFSATVDYLSTQGEFTPRNLQTKEKRVEQVFRCKLRIDAASDAIRPGMVCDVSFSRPGASTQAGGAASQ